MPKPNFFLVGAPRCGTTSMYSYLKQHPQVFLPILKEPHFFGTDLTVQPHTIRDRELYLGLFADAGEHQKVVGEGSVWYLSSPRAPGEIKAFSPEARVLIMLRDPADMTYSLYSLYRRTGNEDLSTFEEALAAEADRRRGHRIPPAAYFPEGLLYTKVASYARQVERYVETFGRDRVRCVFFEDFVADPAAVYRRTLEFLGIDAGFQAELDPEKATQRLRPLVLKQLRRTAPEVRARMSSAGIRSHKSPPRPPLPREVRCRLQSRLSSDVARLGDFLGRDLTPWRCSD